MSNPFTTLVDRARARMPELGVPGVAIAVLRQGWRGKGKGGENRQGNASTGHGLILTHSAGIGAGARPDVDLRRSWTVTNRYAPAPSPSSA